MSWLAIGRNTRVAGGTKRLKEQSSWSICSPVFEERPLFFFFYYQGLEKNSCE